MKPLLASCVALLLIFGALGANPATAGVGRWTPLGPYGGIVDLIEVAPSEPGQVYTHLFGQGVFRSTDGGLTFDPAGLAETIVWDLEVDPQDPQVVYALTRRSPDPERRLQRTQDGGATWEALDGLAPGGWANVVVDPRDPDVLFAVGYSEGVYRSDDGGTTWRVTNDDLAMAPDSFFLELLIDPADSSILYLSTTSTHFRSDDDGLTWRLISEVLTAKEFLRPVPGSPGTLFLARFDGVLVRSDDYGDTWTVVGDLPAPPIQGLIVDPLSPSTLYARYFSTSARSDDGGVSWTVMIGDDLGVDRIWAITPSPHVPNRVYFGTTAGLFSSEDRGTTFTRPLRGGPPQHVGNLYVDPRSPATLYAGPVGASGSFRSVDGGRSWQSWGEGFRTLVFSPGEPDVVYGASNVIWRSRDRGETWTWIFPPSYDPRYPPPLVNVLAVDPVAPRFIYAATEANLRRSTDRGKRWAIVSGGLPQEPLRTFVISPDSPRTVFAGSASSGLYRSGDRGDTWTHVTDGLPAVQVLALAAAPGGVVYASLADRLGIYRSTDRGATFAPATVGLPARPEATSLWVDPALPTTAYATVPSRGVYRTDDGGASWWRLPTDGLGSLGLNVVTAHPSSPGTVHVATAAGVSTMDIVPRRQVLGLQGGRFEVEVEWDTGDLAGAGTVAVAPADAPGPVDLRSSDSAVVQFFSPDNWEMLVKVLDGRAVNGHVWVFFAAATNVAFDVRVRDTSCGTSKVYRNALGTAAPAVTDDAAFDDCADPAPSSCVAGAETFCLGPDRRFEVTVEWSDVLGRRARGRQVRLAAAGLAQSDDSGLFYFFSEANWEMLVKVLDGCDVNGRFWVFSAATTNVGYRLRVRDTLSGAVSTYVNPAGVSAAAITDTEAFATCNMEGL